MTLDVQQLHSKKVNNCLPAEAFRREDLSNF
jgi:hypothetical protein